MLISLAYFFWSRVRRFFRLRANLIAAIPLPNRSMVAGSGLWIVPSCVPVVVSVPESELSDEDEPVSSPPPNAKLLKEAPLLLPPPAPPPP